MRQRPRVTPDEGGCLTHTARGVRKFDSPRNRRPRGPCGRYPARAPLGSWRHICKARNRAYDGVDCRLPARETVTAPRLTNTSHRSVRLPLRRSKRTLPHLLGARLVAALGQLLEEHCCRVTRSRASCSPGSDRDLDGRRGSSPTSNRIASTESSSRSNEPSSRPTTHRSRGQPATRTRCWIS